MVMVVGTVCCIFVTFNVSFYAWKLIFSTFHDACYCVRSELSSAFNGPDIGGRDCVLCQFIEPATFARCAFIFALRNIALGGYLEVKSMGGEWVECMGVVNRSGCG